MSIWKNKDAYYRDLRQYLGQYREKMVNEAEHSAKIELDIKYEKCVTYPITAIVIGGLIGGISWILSKVPVISILIVAFDLHIFLYSVAIWFCVIGIPWLIIE